MCELGGVWLQSKSFIPVIVPPLTFTNLKAVLVGVQALKVADTADLDEMTDEIEEYTARQLCRLVRCSLPPHQDPPTGLLRATAAGSGANHGFKRCCDVFENEIGMLVRIHAVQSAISIELEHRPRHNLVRVKALLNHRMLIVFPADEHGPVIITEPHSERWLVQQVVNASADRACPPGGHSRDQSIARNFEINHTHRMRDFSSKVFVQKPSLCLRPRKSIQHEAATAIRTAQPVHYHFTHKIVTDQAAGRHDLLRR